MIVTRDLSKRYRKDGQIVEALSQVNLDVAKGEFVVVRGKSGSGKSTLLNLLGALARPSSGTVTIAVTRVDCLRGAAATAFRAQHVGIVFQMFHLVPYLSLLENVLLPELAAASSEKKHGALRARAKALLAEFGLAGRAAHRPAELSAGERQRGAIARAILRQPELLLADEPTGNLDPENAGLVLACLQRYRTQGKTVILVTHDDLSGEKAPNARVVRLENGRVHTDNNK